MSADESSEAVPFESALAELQAIVQRLEAGSLGLEESLVQFEEGTRLLRACYTVLQNAEQRVELLTGFSAEGEAETVPFDTTATIDQAQTDDDKGTEPRSNSLF